jgi:hypothetical protein
MSYAVGHTVQQIMGLVKSGAARPHGAQFDNQGRGCRTYLWEDSPQHRVYFFARDGVFYGEFRDEQLDNGRSLMITEHYLEAGVRSPDVLAEPDRREWPFVRRSREPLWEDETLVGSNVTWQSVIHGPDGAVLRADPPHTVKMVQRDVTLSVPAEKRPKDVEYYVKAFRPVRTDYERAIGSHFQRMEKLVDGRCTFWLEWPEADPRLTFELHERTPPNPLDATIGVRTEKVAVMTVPFVPAGSRLLLFAP